MKKFQIINGPNLNKLGTREPEIYGSLTLKDIEKYTQDKCDSSKVDLQWFQSNIEGEIVEQIHKVMDSDIDVLIINPAAYSHTSIAIYDALKMLDKPIVEVHISNVYAREDFRQTMLTAKAASTIMSGLGRDSYYVAISSQLID